MGASNEKGDAKGSVEEGGKMVRARWSGVTKWEGVGWIAGRNKSISKCAWQIAGLALGLLHIPYESKAKRWKKNKLAITSYCDKTLFKPTASPSTGSGGPCNEHKQKAKSCGLNYEILMFHCFTLTISRINTSNALWFSDTRDKNGGNDEGVKCRWTMLNHVEPCWTMLNHVEPCWTMLNPSTSQRNFWLLGKTLFKHCTCLGNFRQRRGFKFYHLQKAKLKGFKGIACRISMFQYMFHLHQVACEGFGFLYVQLELLVDDGHELWAKYHGERSKLESLRVGKQKAKKKRCGSGEGIESHGR